MMKVGEFTVKPGCACPSFDRFRCIAIRYPKPDFDDDGRWDGPAEACQCLCHDEDDSDDIGW
jgi:hypothetical protein